MTTLACTTPVPLTLRDGSMTPNAALVRGPMSGSTSDFAADTWVFVPAGGEGVSRWALAFGPIDHHLPHWSLHRLVADDRFDSSVVFPHLYPSGLDLLRWSATIVGPSIARSLLADVGSCQLFYRQYFAERPDLRWAG